MNDKTFWSILGALLLGWVVLLYVLVIGGAMQDYDKASKELESKVKAMKDFSEDGPSELPTETLLERKERLITAYENNVGNAQAFFTSREDRVDASIKPSRDLWLANYRDEYDALMRRYNELHPAGEPQNGGRGKEDPFDKIKESLADDRPRAERMWRTQRLLVGKVIDAGGKLESCKFGADRNQDRREPFALDNVTLSGAVPPSAIPEMLESILSHSDLALEIDRLVIGKDMSQLTDELVIELPSPDAEGPEEPPVLIKLTVNILKYDPQETSEEEE